MDRGAHQTEHHRRGGHGVTRIPVELRQLGVLLEASELVVPLQHPAADERGRLLGVPGGAAPGDEHAAAAAEAGEPCDRFVAHDALVVTGLGEATAVLAVRECECEAPAEPESLLE